MQHASTYDNVIYCAKNYFLLNKDQIRLEILLDYYEALKNGTPIPYQDRSQRLKMIDKNDYEFNYAYLAKHALVEGAPHRGTFGNEQWAPIGSLTAKGTNVVETFIDQYIEHTPDVKTRISSAASYLKKIVELSKIWVSNLDLYNRAVELFASLISS